MSKEEIVEESKIEETKEEIVKENDMKNEKDSKKKSKQRRFKKVIGLVILVIILITAGSFVYKSFFIKATTMDKKATKRYRYLTAREWVSKDKSKIITFSYSGKITYVDSKTGKVIEGFEKYTNYVYHNSKKLSVYGKKGRDNIDILSIGRNNLKIKYNGKTESFTNSLLEEGEEMVGEVKPSNSWYMCERCDFVTYDNVLYGYTNKLTKDSINCYELFDSNKPTGGLVTDTKPDPGIKEGYLVHPLAKDVRFYTINSSSKIIECEEDDYHFVDHKCELNKITIEQAMNVYKLGKKNMEVYLFANEDMEIDKVILYSLDLHKTKKGNMTEADIEKLTDKIQKERVAFNEKIQCVVDDESVNDIDKFIDNDYTVKNNAKVNNRKK